jgi:DNA-binding protein YbaB
MSTKHFREERVLSNEVNIPAFRPFFAIVASVYKEIGSAAFLCYSFPMVSFSQARDMFRLQRDAKRIKKELKSIHVEAEASGVKVVVTAEQEIVSIDIAPEVQRESIPALLIDALNRAMKKAQIVSAEKMQALMGEMGLPMGGGMDNA